jgi:hypothetical protein
MEAYKSAQVFKAIREEATKEIKSKFPTAPIFWTDSATDGKLTSDLHKVYHDKYYSYYCNKNNNEVLAYVSINKKEIEKYYNSLIK